MLVVGLFHVVSYAYFLQDSFDHNGNGWVSNFCYARDGVVWPQLNFTTAIWITNGVLSNGGSPNNGGGNARNGFWKGLMTYQTNLFQARPTAPFGWEIMRTNARIIQGGGAVNDARQQAEVSLWMFVWKQSPSPLTGSNEWDIFDDFMCYYDFSGNYGTLTQHSNEIGCYNGVPQAFNIQQALGPMGGYSNLTNIILWDYLIDGSRLNTNWIGFRMVHDGSSISFYANPDPYDRNSVYPNEWFLVGNRPVLWSNSIQLMVGTEGRSRNYLQTVDAIFKDFLVRSATSGVGFYVVPEAAPVRQGVREISLIISNRLEPFPDNAGINFIRILKPTACEFEVELLRELSVTSYLGESGLEWATETIMSDGRYFPNDRQVVVLTNHLPSEVRLLLGKQLDRRTAKGYENLGVKLKVRARGNGSAVLEPGVFVMAEQFDGMPAHKKNRYSTCGWEKASFHGLWDSGEPSAPRVSVNPETRIMR